MKFFEDARTVVSVWIVIHSEGYFGDSDRIRGVYAEEEPARAASVTLTPGGRRSKARGAHAEHCCRVEKFEVAS